MKEVVFTGSSLNKIRAFPLGARQDAVYVLHAFQKKTRKTRKSDIDLARKRLKKIGG
jgi:phage-related protein